MKNKINKIKPKTAPPAYVTLGLAEKNHVDPNLQTTSPSLENVEQTKKWSEENKL